MAQKKNRNFQLSKYIYIYIFLYLCEILWANQN